MKKNIFIFIDSLCANVIEDENDFKKYAPFLYSLSKKSMFFKNVYSQGPYTEAGSKALMSGNDVLADNGYIRFINESKNNLFKVNKMNGFKNTTFFLPISIYSENILRDFDKKIYTSYMNLDIYWQYRFKHYSDKYKEKELNTYEYNCLINLLNDIFINWREFLKAGTMKDYSLLSNLLKGYDINKNLSLLNKEYEIFSLNQKQYINKLLKSGYEHNLFKVDMLYNISFINQKLINTYVKEKNKKLIAQIKRKQFINNLFSLNNFKSLISCSDKISFIKNLRYLLLKSTQYIDHYQKELFFNEMPSCYTLLSKLAEEILQNNSESCFYLQIEDLHGDPNFFSYDVDDKEILIKELEHAENNLKKIRFNDKGNVLYLLSLSYIDECFKNFFDYLEENKLLNEYRIIITADHGSSVVYQPVRDKVVNNFYLENYHIPLWLYDNDIKPEIINKIISSKHIINFMNDSVDGIHEKIDRLDDKIIIEYLGPECPDMQKDDIWYGWIYEKFFLGLKCPLNGKIEIEDIKEIYNLDDDPFQFKNLRRSINNAVLEKAMKCIVERHSILQKEQEEYYEKQHYKR